MSHRWHRWHRYGSPKAIPNGMLPLGAEISRKSDRKSKKINIIKRF
jgi:hypothetical protein